MEREEIDAGFAYLIDAKAADHGGQLEINGNISISTQVTYSISVVSSKYTETSQKFFFVTGNGEETILNKYGFVT